MTSQQSSPSPQYLRPSEFAPAVGQSVRATQWQCANGKIPGAFRTPGGRWRIPADALDECLAGDSGRRPWERDDEAE